MSNTEELLTGLTVEIVAAYVAHNAVQVANLPALVESVHAAVVGLGTPPALEVPVPAVDPKKSVLSNYIVCLEDGKRLKTLKRHLLAHYGLTPVEYRVKWGLDPSYPMMAPNYAAKRSELAKKSGFGGNTQAKRSKRA